MTKSRLVALLAVAIAGVAASLPIASPANADTLGPIRNYGNHLCMQPEGGSSAQGAPIVQQPCDLYTTGVRNLSQEWDAICQNSNCSVFYWQNRGNGLCLRARGGAVNGAQIMQWACNWISDVDWDFGRSPISDSFVLRSRISGTTTHCLDVPGASSTPGLALQLYRCNQTVAQIWQAPTPIVE